MTTSPATTPAQTPKRRRLIRPRRVRGRFGYELLACALSGHQVVGTDSAAVTAADATIVIEAASLRWYRCLRCDSWLPRPIPTGTDVTRPDVPSRDEVDVPLRGRALRDKFVLRAIAVDRIVHFLVLAAVAVAIFLFARHRADLQGDYTRFLNRLQGAVGGPLSNTSKRGILGELNKLFAIPTGRLYLYGCGIGAYAVLNFIEAFGLWKARRWAEYLTLIEVAVLIPIEIYELTETVSALKVVTFVINVVLVAYLLAAHRLFGVRGGVAVENAEREEDSGWPALDRTAPLAAVASGPPAENAVPDSHRG